MPGAFLDGVGTVRIYSSDGATELIKMNTDGGVMVTVKETGAVLAEVMYDVTTGETAEFIYEGDRVFLGFDLLEDISLEESDTVRFPIGYTGTLSGIDLVVVEGALKNIQIDITEKGITTLATAGKYCDRNININTDGVYAAGQYDYWESFWNSFQYNGAQTYCPYLFAGYGWRDAIFKPKYNIKPKGNANSMFRQTRLTNLTRCLKDAGVELDTSAATDLSSMFSYSGWLKYIPKISLISVTTGTSYMFANNVGASVLERIEEIEVAATTVFKDNTFANCDKLEHVIFTGTLATNGLKLSQSTLLDRESLISIINILQDKTSVGGTWTVTLGEENLAKLTDAEKAIATQKGWTLA